MSKFQEGSFAVIAVGVHDEKNVGKVLRLVEKLEPINGQVVWLAVSGEPINTVCGQEGVYVVRITENRLVPVSLQPVFDAAKEAVYKDLVGSIVEAMAAQALEQAFQNLTGLDALKSLHDTSKRFPAPVLPTLTATARKA